MSPRLQLQGEMSLLLDEVLLEGLPIRVTHHFTHRAATPEARSAFRRALTAAGFGAGLDGDIASVEAHIGADRWHHRAVTLVPADPETVLLFDALAQDVADAHGIEYDAWSVLPAAA
jgi:hypothetical protein